jgi:hypothetical protein
VDDVTVEIGGLRTAFCTRDVGVREVVSRRYAGFLSGGPPDWQIEIGRRPGGLGSLEDVVVRSVGGRGRVSVERHDFAATLDLDAHAGAVSLRAVDEIAVDTFVRVASSLALLEPGGLLVHAASLGRGGRSWLFAGPSGSGKTTLTRLSPGATLLSDEISIVRLDPHGGACSHGSPFWGELGAAGRNTSLPLAAVHFLRHADRHAATALAPRRALDALLPNVLFFAAEPALVGRVLDVAAEVVRRVPCHVLDFRPEASVWETIAGA